MLPRARPHPFPGTRRRALLVAGLLALHAVAAWLALQAVFVFVELAWRAVAGRGDYGALVAAHLAQFAALRAAQAVLWIVAAAAFVRWTRAAHGNLAALGATGLGYAAPDVPTVFLRPGLALRRPPGLLREIWNASDPRLPGGDAWRAAPAPARVTWWWLLLLAALALEVAARALALAGGHPLDLGLAMLAVVLAQLATIAAAALGIALVLGVDGRQEEAAWRRA